MSERKIEVTASALQEVLQAIIGPGVLMRELQAIRSLGGSPIDVLIEEYNAAMASLGDPEK